MTLDSVTTRYATLLRRYQALVADGVLYFLVAIAVLIVVPDVLEPAPATMRWLFIGFIMFLLLYDPVCVSLRGATLGHSFFGLRVADAATLNRIGPLRALGRGLTKAMLGAFSLLFMLVTRRHQALHDLAFRTVVVLRDPQRATELDYVEERPAEAAPGLPSARRRIVITMGYVLALSVLLSVAFGFVVSAACVNGNVCTPSEDLLSQLLGVAWLLLTGVLMVAGWRGLLPGARRGPDVISQPGA